LLNSGDAWVDVQVSGDTLEMPRQHRTAVPCAFKSNDAVADITPNSVSVNDKTVIDSGRTLAAMRR
jgi:hypothetical protein